MRKLIDFQKPYISSVDLKVKFEPTITLTGATLRYSELFDLKAQIDIMISDINFTKDFFEKYKDDENMLLRLVGEVK